MPSYSVTRLLERLSTLEDRIRKQTESAVFIDYTTDTHRSQVTPGSYQSISDLIELRNRIKASIVRSNALTEVDIGGVSYSVADVIERRRSIALQKTLLERLRFQRATVHQSVERAREQLHAKLDRLLEVDFGKNSRSQPDNVTSITKSFMDNHPIDIIDPTGIDEKILSLEEYIQNFDSQANCTLAESNARTMLDIGADL